MTITATGPATAVTTPSIPTVAATTINNVDYIILYYTFTVYIYILHLHFTFTFYILLQQQQEHQQQ